MTKQIGNRMRLTGSRRPLHHDDILLCHFFCNFQLLLIGRFSQQDLPAFSTRPGQFFRDRPIFLRRIRRMIARIFSLRLEQRTDERIDGHAAFMQSILQLFYHSPYFSWTIPQEKDRRHTYQDIIIGL